MSTDNREDYLINILRLTDGSGTVKTTDIAKYMNVAPASVTEMLKVLSKEGLVNYERYRGVSLTEEGVQVAKSLRRKHHIMERFLTDVLDVDHAAAHDEAHAIEHSLSDDAAARMCRLIGTKVDEDCDTCPDPCDDMIGVTEICESVADMNVGDKYVITHLSGDDIDTIRRLISMGFAPGKEVEMDTAEDDMFIVKMGGKAMALDKDTASVVYVALVKG